MTMGWASGSRLLQEVAEIVMPKIDPRLRSLVAERLIDAFMSEDCDTINEVEQPDIKCMYEKRFPE